MNALRKDFLREIRHTFSRFLSILILVALAVAFLSGLRSTAPDMKNTCDSYLDQQNFMDIQVLGTLGITEEDVALLRQQDNVEAVEPAYVIDAYAHDGALDVVTKLYSMPRQLNQLTVLDGRLPQASNECVVDSLLVNRMGLELGATLEFQTSGDFEDVLLHDRFQVVGVVRSPLYISPERGTSTLGTGQVAAFAYVTEAAFDMDFYTAAYLTVNGAREAVAFSPAYDETVDAVLDQLEPFGKERAKLRRESLVNEGNEKLADAQAELDEAKADAEKELTDAWSELSDARQELDDGWAELADAKQTLTDETTDAEQKIADAKVELADALVKLQDGEAEYKDGLAEYQDGRLEYEDGLAEYEENREKIDDGWREYHRGADKLERGREKLHEASKQLDAAEAQYQAGVTQLDQSVQPFLPPASGISSAQGLLEAMQADPGAAAAVDGVLSGIRAQLDAQEASLNTTLTELRAQEAALRAAIQQMTTPPEPPVPVEPPAELPAADVLPDEGGQEELPTPPPGPTLEELQASLVQVQAGIQQGEAGLQELAAQRGQLPPSAAALQTQLAAGVGQLQAIRSQLDDAQEKYSEGRAELRAGRRQLEEALAELEDGDRQLADAKVELDDAAAKLDDAHAELTDARIELDDGWQEYEDGQVELADARQELTDKVAEAKLEISDAERELRDGEREYADGLAEYQDGKAEAEEKIADAEDEIADARRKIADIGDSEWYILSRDTNPGYLGFGQDADRMANLASVFPVLFFLVAALVCLTTMTRMVEEQRVQIGCLKALGYSRWAISRKYLGYGFLPSLLGGILGLCIGFTLFPKMIFTAYQIMYDVPDIQLSVYPGISAISLLAAVGCTTVSSAAACMNALRETPAALMRPRAPKAGKRILLEYIKPLWSRMSFSHKVTARNLLRYQKRFWMTVIGIGGCTALIIAGFGLRSSLLATMSIQYDEIFNYTAQVAVSENLLDSERTAIDDYIASNPDITDTLACRIGNVTAESDVYNTSAYLEVVDPARINDFVDLRTYRQQETLTVPDDGVIIDQKLSELLDLQPGDTFIIDGDQRVEVRVAAINENYLAHFIYLSPAYYEEVFGETLPNNAYLMAFSDSNLELCDSIFTDLMELHGVVSASRMLSTRDTYMSAMERIDFVVVIVILSAAALALVVLYNLSNINITERRRELATIRVLGFYDREVSAYVNRENTVLTLFGILFGIVSGRILHGWLVRSVEIDLMMFGRETDPMAYLWAALLTALFSAVVAWMSHVKMKRIDMVESLKSAE